MAEKLNVTTTPEHLDVRRFSCVLNSPSQCYKFYWLEAILQLLKETGNLALRFENIIDRMIANAWYTVTMYHLHLGPGRIDNEYSDKVEEAIITLKKIAPELSETAKCEEITEYLHKYEKEMYSSKNELTKNVPYRLLSPFLRVTSRDWYNRDHIVQIIEEQSVSVVMPYTIISAKRALDSTVVINREWAEWMLQEYPVIIDWVNYNKVIFLQARNPEVPGIIYKLVPPAARDLGEVKKLWKEVLKYRPFRDIYTNKLLNEEKYDIDHFVPWSYVAMDELWDLIPAEKSANTSKNNRLPDWSTYADAFMDAHYQLYSEIYGSQEIRQLFEKCRRSNLSSRWANDQLYVPGHDEHQFKRILEPNLKRIYDAAVIQGFETWKGMTLYE